MKIKLGESFPIWGFFLVVYAMTMVAFPFVTDPKLHTLLESLKVAVPALFPFALAAWWWFHGRRKRAGLIIGATVTLCALTVVGERQYEQYAKRASARASVAPERYLTDEQFLGSPSNQEESEFRARAEAEARAAPPQGRPDLPVLTGKQAFVDPDDTPDAPPGLIDPNDIPAAAPKHYITEEEANLPAGYVEVANTGHEVTAIAPASIYRDFLKEAGAPSLVVFDEALVPHDNGKLLFKREATRCEIPGLLFDIGAGADGSPEAQPSQIHTVGTIGYKVARWVCNYADAMNMPVAKPAQSAQPKRVATPAFVNPNDVPAAAPQHYLTDEQFDSTPSPAPAAAPKHYVTEEEAYGTPSPAPARAKAMQYIIFLIPVVVFVLIVAAIIGLWKEPPSIARLVSFVPVALTIAWITYVIATHAPDLELPWSLLVGLPLLWTCLIGTRALFRGAVHVIRANVRGGQR